MRAHLLQYPVRIDATPQRCCRHGYRAARGRPHIRSVAKADTPDVPLCRKSPMSQPPPCEQKSRRTARLGFCDRTPIPNRDIRCNASRRRHRDACDGYRTFKINQYPSVAGMRGTVGTDLAHILTQDNRPSEPRALNVTARETCEMNPVALLTPTYGRDLELCTLLCESVDRHVTSFSKHYLLVPDCDFELFSHFESDRRDRHRRHRNSCRHGCGRCRASSSASGASSGGRCGPSR